MRVIHLNTTVSEGASSIYLHKALKEHGIESHVLTIKSDLRDNDGVEELPKAGLFLVGIKILESMRIRHELADLKYPFNTSRHGYRFVDNEEILQADVIHLHWICGMLSMREIYYLTALGKPVVWTCRDIWAYTGGCHIEYEGCNRYKTGCRECPFLRNGSKLAARLMDYKSKWLGRARITYIAPSRWMKKNIEGSILGASKCVHIPNTRDFDIYRPYSGEEAERILGTEVRYELDGYINVLFGATSAGIPYKGFIYLEKLAERLLTDAPELAHRIKIHMVGNYDGSSEVLGRYSVKTWGYINDPVKMACIYSINDVFVTPSVADNLPSMVMEALGCETPVLAFDTGGTSDMLEHQTDGYLARYMDEDDFFNGFKWVIEHNQDNALGRAGRKKMLDEFSYDVVADQHIQLYNELLSEMK